MSPDRHSGQQERGEGARGGEEERDGGREKKKGKGSKYYFAVHKT